MMAWQVLLLPRSKISCCCIQRIGVDDAGMTLSTLAHISAAARKSAHLASSKPRCPLALGITITITTQHTRYLHSLFTVRKINHHLNLKSTHSRFSSYSVTLPKYASRFNSFSSASLPRHSNKLSRPSPTFIPHLLNS